jgi:hypothetical protein
MGRQEKTMAFVCEICGKQHENWPPDFAFQRPDVIWKLSDQEREQRARESDDLCVLDEQRYYVRLTSQDVDWGLGLWVEVSFEAFKRYHELYDVDGSNEPGFTGRIANHMMAFPDARGAEVDVQLRIASERPLLTFVDGARGTLALTHRNGLDAGALHEVIRIERPLWLA